MPGSDGPGCRVGRWLPAPVRFGDAYSATYSVIYFGGGRRGGGTRTARGADLQYTIWNFRLEDAVRWYYESRIRVPTLVKHCDYL